MTTIPWISSPGTTAWARRAVRAITRTDASWTLTALRLVLGLVMLPHGAQKLLGWYGGYGFTGTMSWFTGTVGLPWIVGFAAILAESAGAIALLAGAGTRLAAFGISANMAGAAILIHLQHGFFINWLGDQQGEGVEYFILALALSITLTIRGGGRLSVDRVIHQEIA